MDPLFLGVKRANSVPDPEKKPLPLRKGFSHLFEVKSDKKETERKNGLLQKERAHLKGPYSDYAEKALQELLTSNLTDLKHKTALYKKMIARLLFISGKETDVNALRQEDIHKKVVEKFSEIEREIRCESEFQKQAGLQSSQESFTANLPLKVAQILLLDDGTLNVGLIEDVRDFFFSSVTVKPDGTKDQVDWEVRTKETLKAFSSNTDFVELLESIQAPSENNSRASSLIRITLGLSPTVPLTNYHARLVALSTLLSAVRQGPVGNCFVICNIIWFLTALIGRVLSDFKTLLEEGAIVRFEEGKRKAYPFLLNIANPDLDNSFSLSEAGMIAKSIFIGHVPGIENGRKVLGGVDREEIVRKTVQLYGKKPPFETTPREFLEKMAEVAQGDKKQAWLAFSAKTNQPLYNAYASAMASIDQGGKNRVLNEKIRNAEKLAFKPLWNSLGGKVSATLISKIKIVFEEVIQNRFLIEYDESVPMDTTSGDEKSTEGSFVYFEAENGAASHKTQISSAEDLRRFYKNSMEKSFSVLTRIDPKAFSRMSQEKVKSVAFSWFQSEEFLPRFFAAYDEKIDKKLPIDGQFRQFSRFGQIGGDNGYVFLHSAGIPLPVPEKTSGTAEERLRFIVELLRKLEAKWHFLENDIEGEKVMMDSDTHAFSLDLENQYIRPWITSEKSVEALIQEKMVMPLRPLLEKEVTEEMRKKMEAVAKRVIPNEFHSLYDKELTNLKDKKQFQPFSEALLKLILKLNPHLEPDARGAVAAKFTNAILARKENILSDPEFKLLESTALPIPDTNWKNHSESTVLSVYFAFAENPITKKIEVFEINENQTGLFSVNQRTWASGPWTFYTVNLSREAKKQSLQRLYQQAV